MPFMAMDCYKELKDRIFFPNRILYFLNFYNYGNCIVNFKIKINIRIKIVLVIIKLQDINELKAFKLRNHNIYQHSKL